MSHLFVLGPDVCSGGRGMKRRGNGHEGTIEVSATN